MFKLDSEKAREHQKNIYFCFIDYVKAFVCVDHNQLWEILKEMGIPDHLTYLLRNLYASGWGWGAGQASREGLLCLSLSLTGPCHSRTEGSPESA